MSVSKKSQGYLIRLTLRCMGNDFVLFSLLRISFSKLTSFILCAIKINKSDLPSKKREFHCIAILNHWKPGSVITNIFFR